MAPTSITEDERLPPGWTKRESKSQRGRFYYVSPGGKTQWVRPQIQPGKLSLSLWKNIAMMTVLSILQLHDKTITG